MPGLREASPRVRAGVKPGGGWLGLAVLVAAGGAAGVLLGMAGHGKVSGAWALAPVLVYAALVVGGWAELGRYRRPSLGHGDPPRGGRAVRPPGEHRVLAPGGGRPRPVSTVT